MLAHQVMRSARHRGRRFNTLPRLGVLFALCLIAMFAQGCARRPSAALAGNDPSDPTARVPAASYRPVIDPHQTSRPVDPAPWRGRNDATGPASKPVE